MQIPKNVSNSVRLLNKHLYPASGGIKTPSSPVCAPNSHGFETVVEGVEIRTNLNCHPNTDIAKLNKLEKAFWNHLCLLNYAWIGCQNITLKISNDCRYSPDFFAIGFDGELIAFETKGSFRREDSWIKLKTAARLFAWIRFKYVTKEKGQWKIEDVKP